MSPAEYDDLCELFGLDPEQPSMRVAFRVHVYGEPKADSARLEGVNYHTAINMVNRLALKFELYKNIRSRWIKRYRKALIAGDDIPEEHGAPAKDSD
jgi:hypothetical protein